MDSGITLQTSMVDWGEGIDHFNQALFVKWLWQVIIFEDLLFV